MEPGRGQAAPAEQQTHTGFLEEILLGTIFLIKASSWIGDSPHREEFSKGSLGDFYIPVLIISKSKYLAWPPGECAAQREGKQPGGNQNARAHCGPASQSKSQTEAQAADLNPGQQLTGCSH